MREPNITGPAGRAWKAPDPTPLQLAANPAWRATLRLYVLDIPGAHPLWNGYSLSLAHLRDIEGAQPAHKAYPEAQYEINVFALDPSQPLPIEDFTPRWLSPQNVHYQFHGVTEDEAIEIVDLLAMAFLCGRASPDTDFRQDTIRSLDATVDHFRNGGCIEQPSISNGVAVDVHRLGEAARITLIGEHASRKVVGAFIDESEPGKIRRYIEKVCEQFPQVRHIDTTPGPAPDVKLVRFGPKGQA